MFCWSLNHHILLLSRNLFFPCNRHLFLSCLRFNYFYHSGIHVSNWKGDHGGAHYFSGNESSHYMRLQHWASLQFFSFIFPASWLFVTHGRIQESHRRARYLQRLHPPSEEDGLCSESSLLFDYRRVSPYKAGEIRSDARFSLWFLGIPLAKALEYVVENWMHICSRETKASFLF